MRYKETGKLDSGINNMIPITSTPSTPTLTPTNPTIPISTLPKPPTNSTPIKPSIDQEIKPKDDGNILFMILLGIFVLSILRG